MRGAEEPVRHAAIFHFGPRLGARKSSDPKSINCRTRVLMTTEALYMRRSTSNPVNFH